MLGYEPIEFGEDDESGAAIGTVVCLSSDCEFDEKNGRCMTVTNVQNREDGTIEWVECKWLDATNRLETARFSPRALFVVRSVRC